MADTPPQPEKAPRNEREALVRLRESARVYGTLLEREAAPPAEKKLDQARLNTQIAFADAELSGALGKRFDGFEDPAVQNGYMAAGREMAEAVGKYLDEESEEELSPAEKATTAFALDRDVLGKAGRAVPESARENAQQVLDAKQNRRQVEGVMKNVEKRVERDHKAEKDYRLVRQFAETLRKGVAAIEKQSPARVDPEARRRTAEAAYSLARKTEERGSEKSAREEAANMLDTLSGEYDDGQLVSDAKELLQTTESTLGLIDESVQQGGREMNAALTRLSNRFPKLANEFIQKSRATVQMRSMSSLGRAIEDKKRMNEISRSVDPGPEAGGQEAGGGSERNQERGGLSL